MDPRRTTWRRTAVALAALLLTLAASRVAAADTITLMWDANPDPSVTGYIVYVGTQPGTYTQNVNVGSATSYTLSTAVPGQLYCFAVSAYAAGPLEGPKSAEVCGYSDQRPTLTNPGAQSSTAGQADSLQLVGSDPDGLAVTYSATGLPPGLTIGASTGFISGTPTTAGNYSVTATVSDGVLTASQTFSWNVAAGDTTAPTISITAPTTSTTFATSSATLTVSGTAADAVGVTQVSWSNDRGGSGVATGTTSWSVTGITLQSGVNVITVTARDAANHTTTDSLTVTYTASDTTAPAVSITTPTSLATFTTSTTPVTVGGTASDAVGVTQVTWANSRGGSGTAIGTTTWSASAITLLGGSNVITITARDAAGNTSTDTLTVTYNAPDTTAPVATITTPTSLATFTTSTTPLTVGGTASDAVGVTQVTWANDRGGSGTATGTTTWSASGITLLGGSNVITITARDAAGNSATDTLTVTYNAPDTTAPVATITTPTLVSTFTATTTPLTVGGTASDAVGVTQVTWVNDRGGSGTATGTTSWSASGITLLGGSNVITITARDAAGNTSTDTLTVTFNAPDTTAPVATITTPTLVSTFTATTTPLTVGGTASDAVGVTQVTWANDRGGSGTATGTTSWSVSGIVLQSGANVITITARDAAGNSATDTLTVTYNVPDTTNPAVTITGPTSSSTHATSTTPMSVSGTASDNVGVTQVTWANDRGGSGTASGTTSWTATGVVLQSGANVITITARDAAGNSATDTLTVTYTPPDTTNPTVAISSPTASTTYTTAAATLSLGGTASDNAAVMQVTWSNNRGGNGMATGTTNWNAAGITLQAGSNMLTVTARDAAGNSATGVLTVTYNAPDTTAPAIAITQPTSASTFSTTTATVNLSGTSSDAVGVTQVTWANDRGGSGTATGTTSWSVNGVTLQSGSNVITLTARDAAGNTATDTLTITLTAPLTLSSLTANLTAPQLVGTPVTFTATATNGTAPYAYKWWLFDGANWTILQNWSTTNTYAWTPTVANSAFRVAVWVRNAGSTADTYDNPQSNGSIAFAVNPTTPPLSVTGLSANRVSPQQVGTPITFTAAVSGGTAPQQFKWMLFDGSNTSVVQGWSSNNAWTWTPTTANAAYQVTVWARNAASSTDAAENANSTRSLPFTINAAPQTPLTLNSLTANLPAPQAVGTPITFTASVSGGTAPHQFKWWVSDGQSWTALQNWSSSNTWTWTPTSAGGNTRVAVWVRNANSTADAYDNPAANASIAFGITGGGQTPAALAVTSLTANRVSPQPVATPITFTAAVSGGTAPQQFKWMLFDGSNTSVVQGWSTTNTWTWTPTTANAAYQVTVWARSAASSTDAAENANSTRSLPFAINPSSSQTPLTLTSLTANLPAPQPEGTPVTFTATVSGGTAPHQFKWWVYDGKDWLATQNWSASNTWTWIPVSGSNKTRVAVWVRNAGSTVDAYDNPAANGSVAFAITTGNQPQNGPLKVTSLTADRTAPQIVGTAVTFTAAVSGGSTPYQYKWWVFDGIDWSVVQPWSTNNTFVWTPLTANAGYRVSVWVRNAGTTADTYDNNANPSISFPISPLPPGPPLLLTAINANLTSPQPVGSSTTFTAVATGGSGSYQYKWWIFDGASWTVATGWSNSNTFTWTPGAASANYRVAVWVRNASSTTDAYDNPASNGSIGFVIQ